MKKYEYKEWKDHRLAFDAPISEISLSMKMLDLIWKPGYNFNIIKNKDFFLTLTNLLKHILLKILIFLMVKTHIFTRYQH